VFNLEVVVPFPAGAIDFSPSDLCRQASGPRQPLTRQLTLEDKGARTSSNSCQWARTSSFTRCLDHTTTHRSRQGSSGRVISSSQRPLPDNTKHSQPTDIPAPPPYGIRNHSLTGRASEDLRLTPRDHWDRPNEQLVKLYLQALLCPS